MDPLRWIILGIGLLVLAGIYLHGRWRERRRQVEARRELASEAANPGSKSDPPAVEQDWELRPASHDMPFVDDQALEALDRLIGEGESRGAAGRRGGAKAAAGEAGAETEEVPEGAWWEELPEEGADDPGPETDPLEEAEARTGNPLLGLADGDDTAEEVAVDSVGPESPVKAPEEGSMEADGDSLPLRLPPASKLEIAAFRTGNPPEAEKIIAVHVEAPEGQFFQGEALGRALRAAGMEPGENRIWHRHGHSEVGLFNVYSAASMVEPGYLDDLPNLETPGLTLFMQLPLPVDGEEALDAMLATARLLAVSLGGELLDANHSTLTPQAAAHIREELREHRRRVHVAAYRTKK